MHIVVLSEKRCTKCSETKPLLEFHRDRASRNGFRTWCKSCANEAVKINMARRRAEMGEEAWLKQQRQVTAKSRAANPLGRERESRRAYSSALYQLRDRHRVEFDALLRVARYERGLSL